MKMMQDAIVRIFDGNFMTHGRFDDDARADGTRARLAMRRWQGIYGSMHW